MKTCKKHIADPVFVYRECAGCELQALRDERDKARSTSQDLLAALKKLQHAAYNIGGEHVTDYKQLIDAADEAGDIIAKATQ